MRGFFESPDYRAHAIACGLDMGHAHAIGLRDDAIFDGWTLAHDYLHPETQELVAVKGERVDWALQSRLLAIGMDYITIQSEGTSE